MIPKNKLRPNIFSENDLAKLYRLEPPNTYVDYETRSKEWEDIEGVSQDSLKTCDEFSVFGDKDLFGTALPQLRTREVHDVLQQETCEEPHSTSRRPSCHRLHYTRRSSVASYKSATSRPYPHHISHNPPPNNKLRYIIGIIFAYGLFRLWTIQAPRSRRPWGLWTLRFLSVVGLWCVCKLNSIRVQSQHEDKQAIIVSNTPWENNLLPQLLSCASFKDTYHLQPPWLFYIPLIRELVIMLGARPYDSQSLHALLEGGKSILIEPYDDTGNEVDKSLISELRHKLHVALPCNKNDICVTVFPRNLSFIEWSLQYGVALKPMYVFNTEKESIVRFGDCVEPFNIVGVGCQIPLDDIYNMFKAYCKSLFELFNAYKGSNSCLYVYHLDHGWINPRTYQYSSVPVPISSLKDSSNSNFKGRKSNL